MQIHFTHGRVETGFVFLHGFNLIYLNFIASTKLKAIFFSLQQNDLPAQKFSS